ncbi:MAG: hypothetical protein GX242_01790 [Clostridiales bacterium]|nr:hypothetical protein [Clostridiales bacterium]
MALLKKTVVLTNNGAEGYMTVVRVGDEVGAKIVGPSFEKGMFAAIKIGAEPIFYAKLDGERTEISLNVSFNQNDDISCVIVKDDMLIARAGRNLSAKDLAKYFFSKETTNTFQDAQEATAQLVSDTQQPQIEVIAEQTKPEEINKESLQELNIVAPTVEPSTDTPLAKSAESIDSETEKEFLSRLHSTGTKNFYQNVKERLDDLFIIHPRENELERIIPESKWVKIRYDGDDYYVVGSLTDDGTVAYLAYGVPGVAEIPPPKLASDISDWLPVPNLPPPYQGYWLIFQNADDGKLGNIK